MIDHDNEPEEAEEVRPHLRVTTRCLDEDLEGTTAEDAKRLAEELDNELVKKFVSMRSQDPKGTEKVQPLENASEVFTLHASEWRGATWHDRNHNVVWLLAGRLHRSGKPEDAYPHFKSLDADQRLLPRAEDYELLLALQAETFVDDVMEKAPGIMEAARRRSPAEVRALVGTVPISVAVVEDGGIELVYLALMLSDWSEDGPEPPANWTTILWAVFFPWVSDPMTEIDLSNEIAGRPIQKGELIYVSMSEV